MNLILFEADELGAPLPKRDERAVHLVKVLHKVRGDSFEAGIIGGGIARGRIEAVEEDGALRILFEEREPAPERHPVRVAVGFPRPIQLRRLLRDLSSLGVAAIDLMGTELGEKSYRDTKLLDDGGARAALIEGAAQARDTLLPELAVYSSLGAWLQARPWERDGAAAVAGLPPIALAAPDNVRPGCAFSALPVRGVQAAGEFVIAVGSERGWSDGERERLEKAGFVRVSMGARALRTETACVAAVVLALEKIGALG
jgi:RsmE family RNA methyltransferase